MRIVTKTESYFYQPTPEDVQNFEAIWIKLWHPTFKDLPMEQYTCICNFAFEVFIVGVNQNKHDIILNLERAFNND